MKHLAIVLSILMAILPCTAIAQVQGSVHDPEKIALIKEMLETTGSINLGRQIMARMVEVEKQGKTAEEIERIDLFASRMDPAELIDHDVYDRHFTKSEIRAIVEFYKTETGKKLLKEMPVLLQEGMNIGAEWAKQKAIQLQQEMGQGAK